jgi:hypothetical protein
VCDIIIQERFWGIEEAARQLEPTFIVVPHNRDGESSHALGVERRDPEFVGDVHPILHENPKFNAF